MQETEQKKFYVYVLSNSFGHPFYVGKGTAYRINAHTRNAVKGMNDATAVYIREIWESGGELNSRKIFETDSEEEAFAMERSLIERLRGRGIFLVNKTNGGNGGFTCDAESSEKKSQCTRDQWKDPIVRKRRIEGLIRSQNHPDVKKRKSESLCKSWSQDPFRRLLASARQQERANLPKWLKEHGNPNKGKKMPQWGEAVSQTLKREAANGLPGRRSVKVRCVETGETFLSMRRAGKSVGADEKQIWQATKTGGCCRGLHWEKT